MFSSLIIMFDISVSANQYDSLSPFLVPVTSTVCLHLRTVKLLVATQRSVIIIPKQVGGWVLGGYFLSMYHFYCSEII